MKKTLTITTARAQNYGAVLQSYALQKTIEKFGAENRIIFLKKEKPKLRKNIFEFLQEISKDKFKFKCIKILEYIFELYRSKHVKQRFNKFISFSEHVLKHTSEIEVLDDLPLEEYVALITGSDQVFNTSLKPNIKNNRFLICNKKIKKYSFAAGLSSYALSKEDKLFMEKALSKYETISVRETQAAKYLEKELKLDVQVNIDPVFNLSKIEWENMIEAKRIVSKKYILCYFLISSPYLKNVLEYLKNKYKLPIICVQTGSVKRIKADKYIFNAGPLEFLNLIKNAEVVVTTSFHGTAFSIIFEKDFYSVIKPGYKTERFTSLLNKLELADRIIDSNNYKNLKQIDYDKVNILLEQERKINLDYIGKILE